VVGVLSDSASRVGREIYGVPVLGTSTTSKPWSSGSPAAAAGRKS